MTFAFGDFCSVELLKRNELMNDQYLCNKILFNCTAIVNLSLREISGIHSSDSSELLLPGY
jgi:hypothetical protein